MVSPAGAGGGEARAQQKETKRHQGGQSDIRVVMNKLQVTNGIQNSDRRCGGRGGVCRIIGPPQRAPGSHLRPPGCRRRQSRSGT